MGRGGSGKRYPGVEARGAAIRVSFMWRGRRFRETLKLPPTPPNLTYAARLRGEILRKIAFGTFNYAEYFPESDNAGLSGESPKTFRELAETWLESAELAKSTREGYRKSLNTHVYPAIGDKRINTLGYLDITKLLSTIEASKKTRNNTLIPIRRVFDIAYRDGMIESNPAARVEYAKHQTPPPDPFSPQEVDAILVAMLERYGVQVQNWFGLGFFAGARPSEQIATQWADMDWSAGIWRISRAKVRLEEKSTKTGLVRDHELSSRARQYLEQQRPFTQLKTPLVFLDPVTGKAYNDDKPPRERYWRPVLTALKIRYREPYQMRHTYATMAIMAGANPVYVARQMGNSPRVVFKHYARWIETADRSREREKIENALGQIWGKSQGKLGGI